MLTIAADLHNHFTTKSRILDPFEVVARVRNALGEGGMCAITNFKDQRYEAFAQAAEGAFPTSINWGNAMYFPGDRVAIVRAEETRTASGDVLVIGMQEGIHLPLGESLEHTLKYGQAQRGIVVLTSPYFRSNVGNEVLMNRALMNEVDAIETHNGSASRKANASARALAERLGPEFPRLGYLAASDGHSFREVGSSCTFLSMNEGYDKIEGAEGFAQRLRVAIHGTHNHPYAIIHRRVHSRIGPMVHGAIIAYLIAAQKAGFKPSLGDPYALR